MIGKRGEIWKDIRGYEGIFQVSNFGRVRSVTRQIIRIVRGQLLKPSVRNGFTYPMYSLGNGKRKSFHRAHTLVLEAFVGPRPKGYHACHNDGNRMHNHVANLRWDTPSGNLKDIAKHGTRNWKQQRRSA